MSLKQVPPNAPSLITSIGVLFGLKSIYKIPLSSKTELFNLLKLSFLSITDKLHLKIAPFTFNVAIFLKDRPAFINHDKL